MRIYAPSSSAKRESSLSPTLMPCSFARLRQFSAVSALPFLPFAWKLFSGERDRLSRLFAAADEGVAKDEAEVVEKERKLRGVYGDANEAAGVYGEV